MPVRLTLALVALLPMAVWAQLPRPADLGGIVRRMPSLERFISNRPLETDFDDTAGQVRMLDRLERTRQPGDLRSLPRTSGGAFVLRPGLWEGSFESFCLRTATWAPGAGDGYLWAPIKGSRSGAIATILRSAARHPNVPRGDIQTLLWAILSRTRVSEMPPALQAAARALLPAAEINAINASGFQAIDIAERTQLFRGVSGPIRQALEIESDLRYEFSRANANYAEIEKIAVLSGAPPPENRNAITRGQWSRHPCGFFIRYLPDSFSNMTVQVLKPAPVVIARDRLNRITLIEDARGRTELTYSDAIAPRPHPTNKRLVAYAFKHIRITRRGAGGAMEVIEYRDQGYTFNQSRPRSRGVMEVVADVATALVELVTGTPLEARQGWAGWGERIERAQEVYEDAEYLRDRIDATTTTGDASSVDDAADAGHVRDGVIVIVVGDTSDRVGFITEMHERFNEMLEYATSVLNTLPDGSYDPGGGVAVPSGGGQTLGSSGR